MIWMGALLTGCYSYEALEAAPEPDSQQEILYYGRYTNMAWVPTDYGFFVTRQGDVYSFDLEGNSNQWELPTDEGYALGSLEFNISHNSQLLYNLESEWLARHPEAVQLIAQQVLSQGTSRGADQGSLSLYALYQDPVTEIYQEHLVGAEGDWDVHREGETAEAIQEWLRAVYQEVREIQ
ncbi:MAG TPA: hypothetical protein DCE41_22775 [Cytophagales bacterium]|nr:hypothetical protein [Cytophagales bacterium]